MRVLERKDERVEQKHAGSLVEMGAPKRAGPPRAAEILGAKFAAGARRCKDSEGRSTS